MARKLAFVIVLGLTAAAPGVSAGCEWHEMAAYGDYSAPQRYSPFAHAAPTLAPQGTPDQAAPTVDTQADEQSDQDTATADARPRVPEENARGQEFAGRTETDRAAGSQ
ncbi:MAG: hypothetical protein ABL932_02820 [Terricaulis sp.]